MASDWFPCELVSTDDISSSNTTAVVVHSLDTLPDGLVKQTLQQRVQVDASATDELSCGIFETDKLLIYSPTGPVDRDYDDVRRFYDAGVKAIKKMVKSGATSGTLVTAPHAEYPKAQLVTLLGCLNVLYSSMEMRQDRPQKVGLFHTLHVFGLSQQEVTVARALARGLIVARDIGQTDPERMAPPAMADYVSSLFANEDCINVKVKSCHAEFEKDYPLLAAVNRASQHVERYGGRVIHLEYTPPGNNPDFTLMLVGKGISMDTGGMDLKVEGSMRYMCTDKCGAAAVAGLFEVCRLLRPTHLKLVACLACVRNGIGPEAYVTDEVISSRAGVRVRILNADAEGRMAMADPLCELKERAEKEKNPLLITVATLTGSVKKAYGPYSAVMENGTARKLKLGMLLQDAGDVLGDMFELCRIRREDYEVIESIGDQEDILQVSTKINGSTNRAYQYPAVFLQRTSGLDKVPSFPYLHLDIAGSAPIPNTYSSTGAPVLALTEAFLFNQPTFY